MVKEVVLSTTIQDFTAQDYHAALYETGEAFQLYHNKQGDAKAKTSDWEGGARTVQFHLVLKVPQSMLSIIGCENTVSIVETQRLEWQGPDKFLISSEPVVNMPGSSRFTTSGSTTVSTISGNSCKVETCLKCVAGLPWPMQSKVESIMAAEAETGVQKFLDFAVEYCQQFKDKQRGVPPAGLPPSAADVEMFYDAWEDLGSEVSAELNNQAGAADSHLDAGQAQQAALYARGQPSRAVMTVGNPAQVAGLPADASTPELMLHAVQELQQCSRATAAALSEMVVQLRAMNEQVRVIRQVVAPSATCSVLDDVKAGQQAAGSSRSSSLPYGYYWMMAAVAGASAGAIYLRAHQRG